MSDTKIPFATAMSLALKVQALLIPVCMPERCVIVGSLRREKEIVGDIELLLISKTETRPDPEDMFGNVSVSLADELINGWLKDGKLSKRPADDGKTTWGRQNKLAVHAASGIALDLFSTSEENWFNSLVIRTGSKDMNLELTRNANYAGRSLMAYGNGVKILREQMVDGKLYHSGDVIQTTSEEDVFRLCNTPYREPKDRQPKELP